jgi:GNAT superfamily N-acetyltransferase
MHYIQSMDLRIATETDFEALMRLINKAFQIESFFKLKDRVNAEILQEYFRKGSFLIYEENGEENGEESGQFLACVFVELKGNSAYLGLLSVDPKQQKKGLGRRLVAAAEEFARESGAHFMELTIVNLRTELLAIYEKLGYKVTGTEPFPAEQMPVSQPCHFICMKKELGHR